MIKQGCDPILNDKWGFSGVQGTAVMVYANQDNNIDILDFTESRKEVFCHTEDKIIGINDCSFNSLGQDQSDDSWNYVPLYSPFY